MPSAPKRPLRLLFSALAACVLVTGLIACGGGSDSTDTGSPSGSDEDQITTLITEAIESDDGSLCTNAFSEGFVENITGQKGDAAVKTCEKQLDADNSDNTDIEVTNIKVNGDKASASVKFKADIGNGKTETVARVRESQQEQAEGNN